MSIFARVKIKTYDYLPGKEFFKRKKALLHRENYSNYNEEGLTRTITSLSKVKTISPNNRNTITMLIFEKKEKQTRNSIIKKQRLEISKISNR